MLFKVLKSQIERYGLTDAIRERIEVLYAGGKLTTEQYEELMAMG